MYSTGLCFFLASSITLAHSQCLDGFIKNGICDQDCLTEEFRFDGGDCCKEELVGNGECNTGCLNQEFMFDAGDCCDVSTCFRFKIGDGNCDNECLTVECGFDGGDCTECVDDTNQPIVCPEHLSTCALDTGKDCNIHILGDNFCDNSCREAACFQDKGDCKLSPEWRLLQVVLMGIGCIMLVIVLFVLFALLCGRSHYIVQDLPEGEESQYSQGDELYVHDDNVTDVNEESQELIFKKSDKQLNIPKGLMRSDKKAAKKQISPSHKGKRTLGDSRRKEKNPESFNSELEEVDDSEEILSVPPPVVKDFSRKDSFLQEKEILDEKDQS